VVHECAYFNLCWRSLQRCPPKSYQKSKLIHTKDILGFFYLVGYAPTYFFIMDMHVLLVVYNIHITMMVFHMNMLYMTCVCILKACFEKINENLAHMQEFVMKNEKLFGLTYYVQKNPLLLMKLKALKKHVMISDTLQRLNMIFSLQLVTTVVIYSSHKFI